jgi:hypothetical protein
MSGIPAVLKKGGFRGRAGDLSKVVRCGAKTRAGSPCQLPAERNPLTGLKKRCRLHGGRAGVRTAAGRARISAANLRHGLRSKAFKAAQQAIRDRIAALKAKTKRLNL